MHPLPVSVVIPCFNDGATVPDAVASARRARPAEIVIVNDGSTDPLTLQVLADMARITGVRVIDQPNTGLAGARMRGVRETAQPYVMALDADDELVPGALERMVAALETDPTLAVVWGDIERFGAAGHRIHPKAALLDPWRITYINELVASTLVRRSDLIAAGGWTLNAPYEDWDLWMAMAERGMQGRHVGGTTLRYRVDEPRMYRTATRRHGELMRLLHTRHSALFAAREHNRRMTSASWVLQQAWRATGLLPAQLQRYAVFAALVTCEPSRRRVRMRATQ